MIARDTIEEKLLELQNTKVGLVSSLLSVDSTAVKSLTEEDIARLLG
jgi:SNF2 family DNA or RNA helicase